jgi:hypothetical protein
MGLCGSMNRLFPLSDQKHTSSHCGLIALAKDPSSPHYSWLSK